MSKIVKLAAAAAVVVLSAGFATTAALGGGRSPITAAPVVDVKGPCDEAEHANDPRCAGALLIPEDAPSPDATATPGDDDGPGDTSGPCDEAEHANDPRCTGAGAGDDNSGPGNAGDDDRIDNSGPSENSGPGNADDDEDDDDSGHGHGDDDDDDDHGGSSGRD